VNRYIESMAAIDRKTEMAQWVASAMEHANGMPQAELARQMAAKLHVGFDRSKIYKIIKVYSIVQGGRGALVLENEPYTYTKRPRRLIGVAKGYGVLVNGNSCAREFNHNDIAHVDPHLHPKKDYPCIFQRIRDGEVEAMIKYLDRSPDASETLYYVFQTNPFKKFTIKKADWQKVHVVVGKESGL
jgi:phage repressor protein C with HTH and peptisase S24 domain